MKKRFVSFTNPQDKWVQEQAEKLGISVPELIRRIVDKERGV